MEEIKNGRPTGYDWTIDKDPNGTTFIVHFHMPLTDVEWDTFVDVVSEFNVRRSHPDGEEN